MRGVRGARLRLEGETDLELVHARRADHRGEILAGLVVHGDAVTSGLGDRTEVPLRVLRHQMTVDLRAGVVDLLRDRLQDDRPDRDRLDEVPVADAEMEDA